MVAFQICSSDGVAYPRLFESLFGALAWIDAYNEFEDGPLFVEVVVVPDGTLLFTDCSAACELAAFLEV